MPVAAKSCLGQGNLMVPVAVRDGASGAAFLGKGRIKAPGKKVRGVSIPLNFLCMVSWTYAAGL